MKKVMLIIMDGVGSAPKGKGNAVTLANPANLSRLWTSYPHTYILTSGRHVGLPEGVKGNSEVGHLNIGAGRIVSQALPRINKNIEKGYLSTNGTLWEAYRHALKNKSRVHLMGCFSDGAVHAHIDHFRAFLDFFSKNRLENELFIHAFTDGRDTPPLASSKYFQMLEETMNTAKVGKFGTIIGRSFAMDRNQTWNRTEIAYKLLTQGVGTKVNTWTEAISQSYSKNVTDEFINPYIISENCNIAENDVVIFLNYRSDRAIQISKAFVDKSFNNFQTIKYNNLFFAGMVEYRKNMPEHILYPKEPISFPLGKVISEAGMRQLRISESEKFPHVTYFLNGGSSIRYQGEDRVEIPSPNVTTYDLKPEMSLFDIEQVLNQKIDSDYYKFIVLNIANGDMVGHTGNLEASVKAMKCVDTVVDNLTKRFIASDGIVLITADHGNVEEVIDLKTGQIDTEHSFNPVPFIIAGKNLQPTAIQGGSLKDIAPTILSILGIPIPSDMTGKSLFSL